MCLFIFKIFNATSKLSLFSYFVFIAYSTFYIVGLILSMQIPFVGFQPIRTSEHMAAAGMKNIFFLVKSIWIYDWPISKGMKGYFRVYFSF